ncbi:MAG: hypothetical protein R6U61_03860 [Thermoplasmata archaeon]
MPLCPHCGYYYEEGELYNNTCPRCRNQVEDEASKLWGRDRRGGDVKGSFKISFEILKSNIGSFAIFWLIPLALSIGLAVYQLHSFSSMTSNYSTEDPAAMYNSMMKIYLTMIPLGLLQWVLQLLFIGGVVGMAKQGFETGKTDITKGFSVMKKYPIGIVGAGIILQMVVSFGLCLCVIPGLLFCYWWLFTIPAIVVEGKNISSAMERSKNFAKNFKTGKFTATLVVIALLLIIPPLILGVGMSSMNPFRGGDYTGDSETPAFEFTYEQVATQIAVQIISAFVLIFASITITVHFLRNAYTAYTPFQQDVSFKPPPPPVNYNY